MISSCSPFARRIVELKLKPLVLIPQSSNHYNTHLLIQMPRLDKPAVDESEHATSSLRRVADRARLKATFTTRPRIFATFSDALQGGPVAWLYADVKQYSGITGREFKVIILNLTLTTAVMQVKLFREHPAHEIIDLLSLVRQPNGVWITVFKIFQVNQYA